MRKMISITRNRTESTEFIALGEGKPKLPARSQEFQLTFEDGESKRLTCRAGRCLLNILLRAGQHVLDEKFAVIEVTDERPDGDNFCHLKRHAKCRSLYEPHTPSGVTYKPWDRHHLVTNRLTLCSEAPEILGGDFDSLYVTVHAVTAPVETACV